jgi:hypothetical protein
LPLRPSPADGSVKVLAGYVPMERPIAWENIKDFRDRLWSESDPNIRSHLQKLLITEEDKLGAKLELVSDIERHILESNRRIERQQALVATMARDGHDGLSRAEALLDGLIESRLLHVDYRERILIAINQNRF